MEFNLSKDELNQIRLGLHPEWERVGDSSAYGGVFKSSKRPGKVIKVQSGDYKTYDNEIARQFQAQLGNIGEYETPNLGVSNYYPHDDSVKKTPNEIGVYKYSPNELGVSFIEMDEADFADTYSGGGNTVRHAKAKGLMSLYNDARVSHTDDHNGNIKFNPDTGKAVILDYGLAREGDGDHGRGKRVERIQQSLQTTNNLDVLDSWNEIHGDLYSDHITNPTPKSKAALDDWVKQGEEIALKTDPSIPPVNWTDRLQGDLKGDELEKPLTVTRSGAQSWGGGQPVRSAPVSGPPIPSLPNTSWFDGHLAAVDGLRSSLGDLVQKPFQSTPLRGALSVGAADLIPSRESIQTAYQKGPMSALKQHSEEFLKSVPIAAGIGLTAQATPALATAAAYAGPGLVAVAGAEAVDEVVKQQTGESIIPKFQQAIGTKPRTGRVEGSPQEKLKAELDRIQNPPTIKPTTRKPRRTQIKDAPFPDFAHRLRLAGDRFNPSKLEFGLSELIFGR